ncbi:hypothetical protein AB0M41_40825 [Streptomyces sp. NPDC051896]|uniref:hypothetical protein n=1 Tax=Streptomyces sp. NPDC051896 TaxID=3155416 RepID=UPI0034425639
MFFLALVGCTNGGNGQGARGPVVPVRSSAPAAPKAVAGPARPVGAAAKVGPGDSALAKLLNTATLPGESPRPSQEAVVVVHRGSKGSRVFGWISGDSYCLGHSYQSSYEIICRPYDDTAGPSASGADYATVRTVGRLGIFADRLPMAQDAPVQYYYRLAVILDDAGPFRLTGDDHRGVLYQARAVMEPGRAVTFVQWGYRGNIGLGIEIPRHARVCSASSHRCIAD